MMKKYAFILSFFLSCATSAQAFTVKHDFNVKLGVFDASKTKFAYALDPGSYKVESFVATSGVFDTLYPFKAEYSTTGRIKKNELETTSYKYDSRSRFTKRHKELVYDEKGQPQYRISSKNGKEKKVEIEKDLNNQGTTDLQTVFAELALQYNQMRFCDARMQVFDGKRRFDVIFKDQGREQLPKHELSPYFGEASKCSMYIDKLDSSGDDLLWELTQDQPINFWIMEEPTHKLPFIARIEIDETPLGHLEVYTKDIDIED